MSVSTSTALRDRYVDLLMGCLTRELFLDEEAADVDLAAIAKAAAFFGADGVVVTGAETGASTRPQDVESVRREVEVPVFVGSGVTPENVGGLAAHAEALIVGSYLKRDGCWSNAPDPDRVSAMVSALDNL